MYASTTFGAVEARRGGRRAPPSPSGATIASTSRSSASVNFSPLPENTLMPLSSNGLCDAEITMPASNAIAGVT